MSRNLNVLYLCPIANKPVRTLDVPADRVTVQDGCKVYRHSKHFTACHVFDASPISDADAEAKANYFKRYGT